MTYLFPYLAETTAAADPMISGNWIIAVIGALSTAVAMIYGKRQGVKEATSGVILQTPVPTVPTTKVFTPPTYSQHMEVVRRVERLETAHEELRRELGESFRKLIEVGEERKDKLMDKIESSARGFHERVNQIVNEFHHAPKK